jgi:hypothetical protein
MLTLPRRGWLNSLFPRRTAPIRRRHARARLGVELCEDRTLPSSSIPLNKFGQTPQWVPIGPAPELQGFTPGRLNVSGRISGIAADPTNPDRVFVATASGGIWRTLDATNPNGPTWVPLTDHLPASSFPGVPASAVDSLRTLDMGAIAMAPSNPNIIYAAEGEGDAGTLGHGVLKSTDGGNTWTLMGNADLDGLSSHSIVVSAQNPSIVYVASQGFMSAVFRSLDGGLTWTNITMNDPSLGSSFAITDVDVDPNNPDVVYCCAGDPFGAVTNGIYRTSNATSANPVWSLLLGGSTVVPGTLPGNIQLTISPTSPSTLYASLAEKFQPSGASNLLGVYRSNDSGLNWQRIFVGVPDFFGQQGDYNNVVAVSPTNPQVVFVAGAGNGANQGTNHIFMSADGGTTFLDISTAGTPGAGPHTDSHAGAFDSTGRLLLGSDGGIFRLSPPSQTLTPTTQVGSLTWVSLSGNSLSNPTITGLNTLQFYGVALHPRDPNIAMGGTQDNGTARFNDNVGWQAVEGGDGGRVVYDFDNPNHVVIDGPIGSHGANNFVEFSDDGGLTFTGSGGSVINNNPQSTLFTPPLVIDPSRSQRFFLGTDVLNISEDGGQTWGSNYRFFASTPGSTVAIPTTPLSNVPRNMGGPFPMSAIATARTGTAANLPVLLVAHTNGIPFTANGVTYPPFALLKLIVTPPGTMPALQTSDWMNVTPAGAGEILQIIVDPTDVTSQTIYVVGTGGVFRTTNGARSWMNINGSGATALPFGDNTAQLDVRIPADPTDDVLYVGGSFGVMQLTNPLGSTFDWSKTAPGLPDVSVQDLDLNPTTGILAAGTYGRGVWELQVRGLIRGQVFLDTNGNGVKDPGEPTVPNATVKLLNADTGAELANTLTDANGFYEFRSILPGVTTATNFRVVQSVPGFVQTTPVLNFPNFTTGSTFDVADPTLDPTKVNIGLFQLGTVSGIKIEDFNANGLLDPGEHGVPGFTIYVDRNNNNKLDPGELSAVTAANGTYTINGVGPDVLNGVNLGPNIIREIAPVGQSWQQIFPASGFWSISLTSGQNRTGVNFGNIHPSSIAGGKFEDLNGNGVKDPGDPGAGGFTIQLINPADGTVLQTTTTAPDGSYIFRSLVAGNYRLREVPLAGWVQTTPNPADITLGPNQQITNVPFGNFHTITVSGVKFDDRNGNGVQDTGETGASGFTFELVNTTTNAVVATTVSDGTGAFQFTGIGPLPAGSQYRVREQPMAGWIQTTADPAPFTPVSSQNVTGLLFGNFHTVTISGTVYVDLNRNGVRDPGEPGVPGFTIQLDLNSDGTIDQTAVTAADGSYTLAAGPGTHTITEQPRRGFTLVSPISGSYQVTVASGSNITGQDFGNIRRAITVTANDADGPPTVTVRDATTNRVMSSFDAYDSRFTGGVRVAVGYVNGDQTPDIITAPGPGGGPHVKVFDGATGDLLFQFMAYDVNFRGGVYVAAADVNGDGIDDIITGAGASGGPHVKVFDGLTGNVIYSFFAYDPAFRGGVEVAGGDTNGDGRADIITGAGPGGGPHVKVFSGANLGLLASFFAYDTAFRGGVFVAAGDVNGDGRADVITGAGPGGGPHVEAFDVQSGALLRSFLAFTPASLGIVTGTPPNSGARVASYDVDLDGVDDFIVSTGRGNDPLVRIFRGTDLGIITQFDAANPTFLGGIFVAGH